jgi:sulfide:quinone oxidoreductase
MSVNFHAGLVTGLKEGGRVVETTNGNVSNDGLIIASGGRFIKKLPGIEHAITPCEGIPAAEEIRDRLHAMKGGVIAFGFAGNPKEPSAMRGGPMFEFMFGIDALLRRQKRRDNFKLVFFSPATEPGKRLGPEAMGGIISRMQELDIETHLGNKMVGFEPGKVITSGGEIPSNLTIFMPGMTGNKWFDNSELPRSEGGLIKADAQCRVEGLKAVYVAGDSGSFPGPEWLPKQAHMADLQAEAAAKNLLAEFAGEPVEETFTVELICIVDTLDAGMMVQRTLKKTTVWPAFKAMHWLKRLFEWWYIRQYR